MFGTMNFNYYDINEILNYIEELKIQITPQLKYDIAHYRKPIPKNIIKKIKNKYEEYTEKYFGKNWKERNEEDMNKYDLVQGMFYSSIVHNGKRGL